MTLSPALAQALAAVRPALNARVAAARQAQPGFDTDGLTATVRDQLDPIVAAMPPEHAVAVTIAGFEMIVALVARRLIGPAARDPIVNRLWAEVAPAFTAAIAERPIATLGSLTNAVLRLAATPGARVDQWLDRMRALAPLVDADTLRAVGQIAAWRAGMAHYRAGALAAADTLPEPLALAATGGTGTWADTRAGFAADPWWSPDPQAAEVSFGGFAGFGGPFTEPPSIAPHADGFLVRSGEKHGLLIADAYGATLHPATSDEYDDAPAEGANSPQISGASVAAGDRTLTLDLPAGGLRAVANAHSIAIVSPFSHFVQVQPWRRT